MKPWEKAPEKASQSTQGAGVPWKRHPPTSQGGEGPVGAYRQYLDKALSLPGYDSFLTTLESGGKADAKAPSSSATGLHQFTSSTWLKTVQAAKPAWAEGQEREALLELRKDPEKSKEMEGLLREQNAAALSVAEQPINEVNLYAAHHFGAAKGVAFAKAEEDAPIASILTTAQLQANKYLRGMTKRDVIKNWLSRGKPNAPWNRK